MRFLTLLTLRIRHDYYPEGTCLDFEVVPTPPTEATLRNHRCWLKPSPDGLRLVTVADASGKPFLALPARTTLEFQLRLHNPDFPLFTDLTAFPGGSAPYFTNRDRAGVASPTVLDLKQRAAASTESWVFPAKTSSNSFRLAGQPREGGQLADFVLTGLASGSELTSYDAKRKTITVRTPKAEPRDRSFTVTYPIQTRSARGVFAEVELVLPDFATPAASPLAASPEYRIEFRARQVVWRYYLCTNRTLAAGTDFSIASNDPAFKSSTPEASDEWARSLQIQNPGFIVKCFDSVNPVPCRMSPRTQLQLKLGSDSLLEPLPNPPLKNLCRINQQLALFQTLKDAVQGISSTQSSAPV